MLVDQLVTFEGQNVFGNAMVDDDEDGDDDDEEKT